MSGRPLTYLQEHTVSLNRENVVWQSADGTWSLGHFDYYVPLDGDYEWDAEYDMGTFWWVATGYPTAGAAFAAWTDANPGMSRTTRHTPETAEECAELDAMAADVKPGVGSGPRQRGATLAW